MASFLDSTPGRIVLALVTIVTIVIVLFVVKYGLGFSWIVYVLVFAVLGVILIQKLLARRRAQRSRSSSSNS